MKYGIQIQLIFFLVLFVGARELTADAIVITKAATATTIAEIFVSEQEVRVELEIGQADLKAFRNPL